MPDAPPASSPDPRPEPRWPRRSVRHVVVADESMAPTLRPGDRLLVDRRAYRDEAPRVGDVVVLADPEQPGRWLVKRVAAVGPGRFWPSDGGPLPVAGPETDGSLPPGRAVEPVSLAPASVYVLGDGPGSRDSRQFGPVPGSAIVGRAYRRYAPADRRRAL